MSWDSAPVVNPAARLKGSSWDSAPVAEAPRKRSFNPIDNFTAPIVGAYENLMRNANAKPQVGRASSAGADLAALAISPLVGAQNVFTRPLAEGLNATGAQAYRPVGIAEGVSSIATGRGAPVPQRVNGGEAVDLLNEAIGSSLAGARPGVGGPRVAVGRRPTTANPVTRVANRATGGRIVPPEESAAQQLVRGQDPQALLAERARLQGLGVDPSVLDVVNPSGQRLVRAAASSPGPAADMAVEAAARARVDTKPSIMQATRSLSSETRTPQQMSGALADTRDALASTQYREPYAARLPFDERIASALDGVQGEAAIRRAIRGADARRDQGLLQELNALLSDTPPADISGQALDRIRIAMRQRAQNAGRLNAGDVASGIEGRMRDLDSVLDAAPGLQEARSTYRGLQGQIDVLDDAPDVFTTAPADFTDWAAGLSNEQRQAAIVKTRQDILDTLGGQRAATTGSADALATSQYARQNLETLLGPEAAQQYVDTIQARLGQNAARQFVSPNTGSQTFLRAQDQGAFDLGEAMGAVGDTVGTLRGSPQAAGRLITRIVSGATMTTAEREQIVQLGLGSADELERIIELANRSRAIGRAPPQRVRSYIARAVGALGPQHPASQSLLGLLGPAGAAADQTDAQPTGELSASDWLRMQQQSPPPR